jgi:hypothetical protein
VFDITVTVAGDEHPFEGSVTVNVYVPAAITVGVAVDAPEEIPDPVQLNVAPLVLDEPLSTTDVTEHVNVCDAPAFALGTPAPELTATVAVAEHPLLGSVVVKVYVPTALTVADDVVPPETMPGPLQLNETPEVVDDPFNVTDVAEQVNV